MWEHVEYALEEANKYEVDFVEVRGEIQKSTLIRFTNNIVKSVESTQLVGLGITVVIGKSRGHGFTTDLSKESIRNAIIQAVDSAKGFSPLAGISAEPVEYSPKDYAGFVPSRNKDPEKVELGEKIELVMRGVNMIMEKTREAMITAYYAELCGERFFLNSEGLKRYWRPMRNGIYYHVVVRKNGNIGVGRELFASSYGLEIYEKKKPEDIAKKALDGALE